MKVATLLVTRVKKCCARKGRSEACRGLPEMCVSFLQHWVAQSLDVCVAYATEGGCADTFVAVRVARGDANSLSRQIPYACARAWALV